MFLPRTTFRSSFRDGFFLANSQSMEEQKAYLEFYNYTSMPYMVCTSTSSLISNHLSLQYDVCYDSVMHKFILVSSIFP